MSSDNLALAHAAPEQRLHPLSWLFVLVSQLRQFALPLLLVLITGKRNDNDFWGLIGVGALVVYSLAQYFTFRYRIDVDGVVIRSGVFQRSVRHVPFGRIQNVTLHQNMLHRLFAVAEVRLESAGGAKPEGLMRVLTLQAAHSFEQQIRAHSRIAGVAVSNSEEPTAFFSMPIDEVIRLGLINNRGMLLIGGIFGVLVQTGDNLIGKSINALGHWLSGQADAMHLSILGMVAGLLALFVLSLLALRVVSVVIAVLQFAGFHLVEIDGRISMERGLLTRMRGSLPGHRIQAFSLHESLLHRWFGRRSLHVDTAVAEAHDEARSLRDLVPLARPDEMDALIEHWLPSQAWPIKHWQPLHHRAWRRKFMLPTIMTVAAMAALFFFKGTWALCLLALLPIWYWRALIWARYAAYSVDDQMIAFRGGWLDRYWRFAEIGKIQAVQWRQSPFDRRHAMATLEFDTVGAAGGGGILRIPYLPVAVAQKIFSTLSVRWAQTSAIIPAKIEASTTPEL